MAYWLDHLPAQSVLDGERSFSFTERSNLELSPVSFDPVLPTYLEDSELLAYETKVLSELGML